MWPNQKQRYVLQLLMDLLICHPLSNTQLMVLLKLFHLQHLENYTIGIRSEVLSGASERLKELLGFRVWCGYGRTGDPTVDFVEPAAEEIGELKND